MKQKVISMEFNLKEDYRFSVFLIALILFLFFPSFFVKPTVRELFTNLFFILLLISSLFLIETDNVLKRTFVFLMGAVTIAAEILQIFFKVNLLLSVVVFVLLFIYFIIIEHELLIQIFNSKIISLHVVFGAFTGYILIGLLGSFIFRIIYALQPESFNLSGNSFEDLMYYSFITLTTIGYGDVSPLTSSARNVAVLLGLIGQFYNAIIMAVIIGKFLQRGD